MVGTMTTIFELNLFSSNSCNRIEADYLEARAKASWHSWFGKNYPDALCDQLEDTAAEVFSSSTKAEVREGIESQLLSWSPSHEMTLMLILALKMTV
jgi:hypothetical protein